MAQPQASPLPDLGELLRRAAAHHQRGELDQAEPLYRQVLERQPGSFDALHLLGVLKHQRGENAEALHLIAKALAANAGAAAAHSNHGIVLAVLARYDEAVAAYERAIALKPDYAEAYNNRGNALRALKRNDDALESFAKALTLRPDYPDALNNRGNALFDLGRFDEALASYDAALARRPNYLDALVNRGRCLFSLKRIDDALASFERATALEPRYAPAWKERGHVLRDLRRVDEALLCYDRVLALTPNDAETYANRGLCLRELKRYNEAFLAYDRALALKPDFVDAVVARGNVFYEMGFFAEALREYERALAMQPDYAFGFNNRGNALNALGRHGEALASYERAIALKPDYTEAYNNRGNAFIELNRPDKAVADYDAAIASKPFASALINRGSALRYMDRAEEALASFGQALALEPDRPEAHWNKALLLLTIGDYKRGWEEFEWRWRGATELEPRGFAQPQWHGEDIADKTILLHAEQGFGDSIQFLRYLPLVKARAGHVVLELPDSLVPLLGDMANDITLINRGTPLPPFDVHCPMMSQALSFGTTLETIPAAVPYLHVPQARRDKWRALLPATSQKRVGLVWSGKPSHKNDHNRSIALERLAPLFATPNLSFVSLQREYRDADVPALARFGIQRIDDALGDFADTAAAMEQLDLVVAVDTAVAHLAGALGRPLWLLVSNIQDWRWLRDRNDSPWYPTARLFRQPRDGKWDSVLTTLARELAAFAGR